MKFVTSKENHENRSNNHVKAIKSEVQSEYWLLIFYTCSKNLSIAVLLLEFWYSNDFVSQILDLELNLIFEISNLNSTN